MRSLSIHRHTASHLILTQPTPFFFLFFSLLNHNSQARKPRLFYPPFEKAKKPTQCHYSEHNLFFFFFGGEGKNAIKYNFCRDKMECNFCLHPPQAKTVSTAAFKHLAGWLATILAIEGFGDAGREMHLRTRRTAS